MRARRAGTPPRRADAGESRRAGARRGPGAVGNSRIVAYRARSPARSAAEGHAHILPFEAVEQFHHRNASDEMAELTIGELARVAEGEVEGDPSLAVSGVKPLDEAGPGDLSFVAEPRYFPYIAASQARALIVARGSE